MLWMKHHCEMKVMQRQSEGCCDSQPTHIITLSDFGGLYHLKYIRSFGPSQSFSYVCVTCLIFQMIKDLNDCLAASTRAQREARRMPASPRHGARMIQSLINKSPQSIRWFALITDHDQLLDRSQRAVLISGVLNYSACKGG